MNANILKALVINVINVYLNIFFSILKDYYLQKIMKIKLKQL